MKRNLYENNFPLIIFFSFIFLMFFWLNRNKIFEYIMSLSSTKTEISKSNKEHNLKIINLHDDASFGIDISEYQGNINWNELEKIEDEVLIDYIIIRASAGIDKLDSKFKENWKKATHYNFIKGAYHYYRPNENSIEQANNFIKHVKLNKGDFPPILDIEKLPKTQSIDSLKVGLKRWLNKVENHYGIKPIIYSGESYYNNFLHEEFKDYQFWIANYNLDQTSHYKDCIMWQFSEKGSVNGIKNPVDLNVLNGNKSKLMNILIR
jgi:lysozyme